LHLVTVLVGGVDVGVVVGSGAIASKKTTILGKDD